MRKTIQITAACSILLVLSINGCQSSKENAVKNPSEPVTVQTAAEIVATKAVKTGTEPTTRTAIGPGEEPAKTPAKLPTESEPSVLSAQGNTLDTRFLPPSGYERVPAEDGSFQAFLRKQPLKADGSPVLLYDGTEKHNQSAHAAVFEMPGFDSDLQQCADSVMRMYAEYFWSIGAYDRIAFHLTNGFLMDYPSWREGNRLLVEGNNVSWVKKASYDDSYETFLLYLKYVMMYAGTLSMDEESEPVELSQLKAGDLFLKGGSPGHCVMVTDVTVDQKGNFCFLLSQSYMPAQDFHVLKNPLHEADPWYYETELEYPLSTPEYTFQEGTLQRWYGFR